MCVKGFLHTHISAAGVDGDVVVVAVGVVTARAAAAATTAAATAAGAGGRRLEHVCGRSNKRSAKGFEGKQGHTENLSD